jgi:hypothetical protein
MDREFQMKVPISVWLSGLVVFGYSAYGFYQNPLAWLSALVLAILVASFLRIVYWFIEGE